MHVFGVFWLDLLFLFLGFFFWIKTDERRTKTMFSMPVDGPRHMVFDWYRLTSTIASRMVLDTDLVDVLDRPRLIPYSTVMHRDQSGEQSESVEFYCFL